MNQKKPKREKTKAAKKYDRKNGLDLRAFLKDDRQDPEEYTTLRGKELISIMSQGYPIDTAAELMQVSLHTLSQWAKKYRNFADAVEIAKGRLVFYLETQLLAARDMRTVRATIRALQQACPEEYS
jgi:hypothetical protein